MWFTRSAPPVHVKFCAAASDAPSNSQAMTPNTKRRQMEEVNRGLRSWPLVVTPTSVSLGPVARSIVSGAKDCNA